MRTSTKWIIGIAVAVIVVICLAGVAAAAFGAFNGMNWVYGTRTGQLWGNQRVPHGAMPFGQMPMPMRPYRGFYGNWMGFFSPLRLLVIPCLCLIVLALIILAIFTLIRNQRRRDEPAAVVTTPTAAAPAPVSEHVEPVAEEAKLVCPNCGQPVQAGWKHCPNCGAPLT